MSYIISQEVMDGLLKYQDENTSLKAQLAKAVEALEFYSDGKDCYMLRASDGYCDDYDILPNGNYKFGKKAREFLAEINNKKGEIE